MHSPTFVPSFCDPDMPCNIIISELGETFFRRVQEKLGGQELKLCRGQRLTENHRVVIALGKADAIKLANLFNGEQFYVPRGTRSMTMTSHVASEVAAGTPMQDIAAKLGISARHVRRLKQRAKELSRLPCNIDRHPPPHSAERAVLTAP